MNSYHLGKYRHRTIEFSEFNPGELRFGIPCWDSNKKDYVYVVCRAAPLRGDSASLMKRAGVYFRYYHERYPEQLFDNPLTASKAIPVCPVIPTLAMLEEVVALQEEEHYRDPNHRAFIHGKISVALMALIHAGAVIYGDHWSEFPRGVVPYLPQFRLTEIVEIGEDDGRAFERIYGINFLPIKAK